VKIFETRKIISKRIIPKVQLPIAKIEFEMYILTEAACILFHCYFTLKREVFIEVKH